MERRRTCAPTDPDNGTWAEAMTFTPTSIARPGFVRDIDMLLEDPAIYRAITMYMIGLRNHRRNQERMLEDVRATRVAIEKELREEE